MKTNIAITALSSVSALGKDQSEIWNNYLSSESMIAGKTVKGEIFPVGELNEDVKREIEELRYSDSKFKSLDASVLYAMYISKKAIQQAGWNDDSKFGVNFGSSRGATELFENYLEEYLITGKASTLSSPTTTLGNISSWVAQYLRTEGPEISHSITCSTALHAVLNGIAWLNSGMSERFLVGGSEASLTPFTLAQMKALKICADFSDEKYLCRSLDVSKSKNSMILGEGAAAICLEKGMKENAIAHITGIGYATEMITHGTSISAEATCFQRSMKMALEDFEVSEIDAIVMHAPGTIKGDSSEIAAIEKVFGGYKPFLTTNKWKIGHTFGASGLLSLELAVLMLQHQKYIPVPFIENIIPDKPIQNVLVNAVGFGGNAVSIIVSV